MPSDKRKVEKKKIALDEATYEKLKNFSRFNGLKARLVVAALIEKLLQDEVLTQQVIELAGEGRLEAANPTE